MPLIRCLVPIAALLAVTAGAQAQTHQKVQLSCTTTHELMPNPPSILGRTTAKVSSPSRDLPAGTPIAITVIKGGQGIAMSGNMQNPMVHEVLQQPLPAGSATADFVISSYKAGCSAVASVRIERELKPATGAAPGQIPAPVVTPRPFPKRP